MAAGIYSFIKTGCNNSNVIGRQHVLMVTSSYGLLTTFIFSHQ